ncbi:hypothetical protein [Vitreimonas flagellata]|uniref:hypothetical protein n=1 Tax=Vitreimonas flagellata TaxID=2560861 RepID=UPI00107535B1|nr:hypothetical protein [Vitreimonas flagellata]
MTKTPRAPSQGGLLGVATLFCAVAAAAGLAFDFVLRARDGFWIGAQPGGMAALGASAAIFAVLAARGARWLLARKSQPVTSAEHEEAQDAGAHP